VREWLLEKHWMHVLFRSWIVGLVCACACEH
jgi:hypothetical protein